MTFKEALDQTTYRLMEVFDRTQSDRLARWLFEECYNYGPGKANEVFLSAAHLEKSVNRLIEGEPIQYITGRIDFYNHRLKVNKHVLIPRPETEELVHWILTDYKGDHKQLDCVDIGTGSGCIAVALKKHKPTWRVFGVEYSMDAFNVTRINAKKLGTPVELFRLNILDPDMWEHLGMMDLIVSNPPYIDQQERGVMSDNVLLYEPEIALFAQGDDPLIFYRRIAEFAREKLQLGGRIYLEMNEFRVEAIKKIFSGETAYSLEIKKDMQGVERMLRIVKQA